jgi:hypothetical protein
MAKTPATKAPTIEALITMPKGEEMALMEYAGGKIPFGILTLNFSHGQSIIVNTMDLCADVIGQALMHGLKQKLVDAAAISRDPSNGRAATVETKYQAVNEVAKRLLVDCQWNKAREGGATGGLLKRALIKMYDGRKTSEQIDAYLAGLSDKEKAALRKHPKVAPIIDELRQADAKDGGEDMPDLLAELERDEEAGVEAKEDAPEGDDAEEGV